MPANARFPLGLLGIGLAGAMLALAPPASGNGGAGNDRPFSQGQDFDSLDAYLAHLEQMGTMDATWYDLQPDGTYVEVRRRPPGEAPPVFTRRQLLDRFGFDD